MNDTESLEELARLAVKTGRIYVGSAVYEAIRGGSPTGRALEVRDALRAAAGMAEIAIVLDRRATPETIYAIDETAFFSLAKPAPTLPLPKRALPRGSA